MKPFLQIIWTIAKHPFSGVAIGLLVALFIYVISTKKMDPVYTVSKPELIAQTITGSKNLKIYWEDTPLTNIASVKVAFWNDGAKYIDKANISNTQPISISSDDVKILAVQVLKTSRPSLNFTTAMQKIEDNETILLTISDDEALEKFDGAILHILYEGSIESNWTMSGRIKGVPDGFKKEDWERVHRSKKPIRWILITALLFMLILSIIFTTFEFYFARKNKRPVHWKFLLLNDLYVTFFVGYGFYRELLYLLYPTWLN